MLILPVKCLGRSLSWYMHVRVCIITRAGSVMYWYRLVSVAIRRYGKSSMGRLHYLEQELLISIEEDTILSLGVWSSNVVSG